MKLSDVGRKRPKKFYQVRNMFNDGSNGRCYLGLVHSQAKMNAANDQRIFKRWPSLESLDIPSKYVRAMKKCLECGGEFDRVVNLIVHWNDHAKFSFDEISRRLKEMGL